MKFTTHLRIAAPHQEARPLPDARQAAPPRGPAGHPRPAAQARSDPSIRHCKTWALFIEVEEAEEENDCDSKPGLLSKRCTRRLKALKSPRGTPPSGCSSGRTATRSRGPSAPLCTTKTHTRRQSDVLNDLHVNDP